MNTVRPITGKTVLFGFLAFFGVIFAVNGAFVYFAIDSWPGLRFDNAYERGINYNDILAKADQQASLKWRSQVSAHVDSNGSTIIEAQLHDSHSQPIPAVAIELQLSRPTHERDDINVALTPFEPGIHRTTPQPLNAGDWQAILTASRDGKTLYRMNHRLSVQP